MRRASLTVAAVAAALLAAATASPARAAAPAPFGHTCAPHAGVRLCAATGDDQRVASFDRTPLDVDVFLPAAGDGPFPTIAMLHGFGGSKRDFGTGAKRGERYSAVAFARRGLAVLVPSARGFGRSCGVAASRTADCAHGYIHLADQRYEVRDVQRLLGLLVDEGVAAPRRLGATGISYGGGTALTLATLRDRVRLRDGSLVPWRSPAGRRLSLAAAWPRWPWSDLADALVPNGRLLERGAGGSAYRTPVGVPLQSYVSGLYTLASLSGYVAPAGADPTADLAGWKALIDGGEPFGDAVGRSLQELHRFHGATGVPFPAGGTPLLLQAGWTDDLFPVGQALRAYFRQRRLAPHAPLALQLADLGHARAANHRDDVAAFDRDGQAFLARHLLGDRSARPAAVTVFPEVCPRRAASSGEPWRVRRWEDLAPGTLTLHAAHRQRVTSSGGDALLAARLAPLSLDPCRALPAEVAPRTAIAEAGSPGVTLLGRTTITARVAVRGRFAQLTARLWDVDGDRQRLVDRGVVRVAQPGRLQFSLNGNGWRFPAGHRIRLELVGRDSPAYRPSNTSFTVDVRDLTVALPTRERR